MALQINVEEAEESGIHRIVFKKAWNSCWIYCSLNMFANDFDNIRVDISFSVYKN